MPPVSELSPGNVKVLEMVGQQVLVGVTHLKSKEWTGKAFNLTELFLDLDFQRIRGRESFFRGGKYAGAEWWHHQWQGGLEKGKSTFGEELLKVYSLKQCRRFAYWDEAKDAVFGVSWF